MRSPTRILLLTALLVVFSSGVRAQQGRVYGTVTDMTGNPVANAKVVLEPEEGTGARVAATTNKRGSFMLGLVRPGAYRPSVEVEGKLIRSLKAHAVDEDKRVAYDLNGAVNPEKPPTLIVEDGFQVNCDFVLGPAVEATTAAGVLVKQTPEQATVELARRVHDGDCAGALPSIEKALAAVPGNATLNYLAGYCEAKSHRTEDALRDLGKAVEADPGMAAAFLLRGQVLAQAGQVDAAQDDLKKVIASSSEKQLLGDAWVTLGILHRQAGRSAEAIDAFTHVLELAPDRPESYVELAELYTKSGQIDRASEILEKARQVGAAEPGALVNVGISYLNRKDYVRAAEIFRKVVGLGKADEDAGIAYALLGRCQLHDGDTPSAIESLKKSIEIAPNAKMAQETREILEALQKKN